MKFTVCFEISVTGRYTLAYSIVFLFFLSPVTPLFQKGFKTFSA